MTTSDETPSTGTPNDSKPTDGAPAALATAHAAEASATQALVPGAPVAPDMAAVGTPPDDEAVTPPQDALPKMGVGAGSAAEGDEAKVEPPPPATIRMDRAARLQPPASPWGRHPHGPAHSAPSPAEAAPPAQAFDIEEEETRDMRQEDGDAQHDEPAKDPKPKADDDDGSSGAPALVSDVASTTGNDQASGQPGIHERVTLPNAGTPGGTSASSDALPDVDRGIIEGPPSEAAPVEVIFDSKDPLAPPELPPQSVKGDSSLWEDNPDHRMSAPPALDGDTVVDDPAAAKPDQAEPDDDDNGSSGAPAQVSDVAVQPTRDDEGADEHDAPMADGDPSSDHEDGDEQPSDPEHRDEPPGSAHDDLDEPASANAQPVAATADPQPASCTDGSSGHDGSTAGTSPAI